ncbi:MAG: MFS transporter [Ktedonobacteraceae bacterium]|nr:MFS transporter [Ktedonobacteraceae bacterium]
MSNTIVTSTPSTNPERTLPWRKWLFAFYSYTTATNITLTSAIWIIYLATHGYSPFAIGLLEMLFHISKFVAEIPTGIFADLVGRRKSLIIYSALNAISTLLFLVPTPALMILSFVLSGLAFAFRGGAEEAILWTLSGHAEPEQQAARYSKLYSQMFLISLVSEITGNSLGGYLGHLLALLPFICQGTISALAIIPLLWIPDQKVERGEREHAHPLRHFITGARAVWHNPALLGLILLSGLTESCWQTIYFYYQLYLHNFGFALEIIGLAVAASKLTSFLFTAAAPAIMRRLPERWLLPTFVIVEVLGLLMMSSPWPVVSLAGYLVLFQASVSVLNPAISTYINKRCPEAQRATVLSLQTGMFSAAMIVLFPLFGLGISHVPYSTAYLWTLEALAGGSVATWAITWLLKRVRRQNIHR